MVTKNSINSNIPIEISKGGTNATSFSTSTGIVKHDGTRLVTSTTALIDASDIYSNTSQPAFSAYLSSGVNDKTGAGAAYTIGTDALTEIFDQGGNFNTNGTFTAPVTGKYNINIHVGTSGSTAATFGTITITTTKRKYYYQMKRPASSGVFKLVNSCIADMDAGDTMTASVTITGDAADTTDIVGDANFSTGMSGYLLC